MFLKMTKFDQVSNIVKLIPRGKVSTYGNVAAALNLKSPRVVGWALRGNQNLEIPCHRVVKSGGLLATNFSLGGWQGQAQRLLLDGVKTKDEQIINFDQCFFDLTINNHIE